MEGSLLDQAESQFDFDGAKADGGEAGFGSGWEDDLESMLLKGMKKKVRLCVGGALSLSLGARARF